MKKIRIKVRCFSQVKYILGRDELMLSLPKGSTTADLEARIREMDPGNLQPVSFKVAVNKNYTLNPVRLHDGDEVALIPPVQGG